MKIIKLLELHHQHAISQSFSKNFGDGFLLKNNRIFRNIRLSLLENKYSLKCGPSTDFQVLPLSQLETILQEKSIPYTDNVTILEKLTIKLKDQISWDDISDGFKRNYVFHESCHCVARSQAEKYLKKSIDISTLEGQRKKCLQILVEESFANTCELLAVLDAQDQAHKIFYELSSYTALYESRSNLKSAREDLGEEFIFRFFLLTYLHSNFLKKKLEDKNFEKTLNLAGLFSPHKIKNLKSFSKIPFTLDLRFRVTTTGLHLRLSGLNRKTSEILDFDFLDLLKKESGFLEFLDSITKIAVKH